jgi:Tfp pilus assembly protein PilW
MTKMNKRSLHASRAARIRKWAGFTLVELMMAMLIFMIVGAAAVSLIKKHMPLYASEQNQASMNVGVRNAVAQMQMDVVNAGSGFYPGANMPFFPVGITIANSGTTGCSDASFNYTTCFDRLNVITADDTIPPRILVQIRQAQRSWTRPARLSFLRFQALPQRLPQRSLQHGPPQNLYQARSFC